MKLATWNVNSLKVRLSQVLDFLAVHKPDVLCLQETKTEDAKFPASDIHSAGYQAVFSGQKTYNGVAILSLHAPQEVTMGIADFADPQKRVISAVIDGVRVICVYIPNGESVTSEKYGYKLDWLGRLNRCLKQEIGTIPAARHLGRLQHRARGSRRARSQILGGKSVVQRAGKSGI